MPNNLIKNESSLAIHGWMLNELNLSGNELMVYSIIYNFHNYENWFTENINYLTQWCNTTKRTIYTTLKSLVDKNLIIKDEQLINNVKFCRYQVNQDFISNDKELENELFINKIGENNGKLK